jgi:hypothetical protein
VSRKTKRPLHPLRIAEAMEAMQEAASIFTANAQAVVSLLRDDDIIGPTQIKMLANNLDAAVADFRAAFWPDGN